MRGIILSGGSGTRLRPLTKITSKQLLPIYNRPMIYYPLNTLIQAGIKEILIIVAPERAGDYLNLLGSGKEFGVKFTYEIQDRPEGIPQAFIIGQNFIDNENVALILGDNIFEDDLSSEIQNFTKGAKIFAKKVADPSRFGVVKFDDKQVAEVIIEKPQEYVSDYAVTGLYLYDSRVVSVAQEIKPSARGELEITDVNNFYVNQGTMTFEVLRGWWGDGGESFDSLLKAANLVARK